MEGSKIKTMLHPLRMRIVQALMVNQTLTTKEISESMPDVAQATLYRHLNKLVEADILTVVEENQVRGTIERVYSLKTYHHQDEKEEALMCISREEHFNYFFTFVTQLLAEYQQYLDQEVINVTQDGVGYQKFSLYLTSEELMDLIKGLNELIYQAAHNKPGSGRSLYALSTILMPQINKKKER